MDASNWARVKQVFSSALECEPSQRSTFLAQACRGDESLRKEVDSLLAAYEEAGTVPGADAFPSPASPIPMMTEEPMAGRRLGPYRVLHRIAHGGMAAVYMAVRDDQQYRQRVAVKLIPPGFDTEELLHRFRAERQTLAALDHPNIVKLLDGGSTEDNLPYLVMEYIEGTPIDQYCATHRLSITERLELFRKVCDAVSYAHQRLVIHRDLKPGNILITAEGAPKLLDFGIAKLLNPEVFGEMMVITSSGNRLMTPEYASPEQVRGEALTNATDIYSLGVVLYELLTGRRPYDMKGHTVVEIVHAICEEDPVKPSSAVVSVQRRASPFGVETSITPEEISRFREGRPEKLQKRLHGDLDVIVLTAMRKEPQRRYTSVYEFSEDLRRHLSGLPVKARPNTITYRGTKFIRRHEKSALASLVGILVATVFLGGYSILQKRNVPALTAKDSVLLVDFANSTGDSTFDDALKQALAAQLEQSPLLNIVSEQKVRETLQLMNRSRDERLTAETAPDVCQRAGAKGLLTGSISSLGSHYLIGLTAVNCITGDALAHEEVEAVRKEEVLRALDQAAEALRKKVGGAFSVAPGLDIPIEQATTPSLEALKAFSLGRRAQREKGDIEAIPFFKKAIELDQDFALAYTALAASYGNLEETNLSIENSRKAYALREHVTVREGYRISTFYYGFVTGELEKEMQIYQVWGQTYPGDYAPHLDLGAIYSYLGEYEKATAEFQQALRIEPNAAVAYSDLAEMYTALNRYDEARATIQQALARKLDNMFLRSTLYQLAFLQGNTAEMDRQVTSTGLGSQDWLLSIQSDTATSHGRMQQAKEFSRLAMESALRNDLKESAALYRAQAALREAELGYPRLARQDAESALTIAAGRDVQVVAALSLARAGDTRGAQTLVDNLVKANPANSILNLYWLPTIRSSIEISRGDGGKAIEILRSVTPYEFGAPPPFELGTLYPIYLRGETYLMLRQGGKAEDEFQKIIDHPGIVLNFPLSALAHLGLARARGIGGNDAGARSGYEKFLALWQDADVDLPVLHQAKTEFDKLQRASPRRDSTSN